MNTKAHKTGLFDGLDNVRLCSGLGTQGFVFNQNRFCQFEGSENSRSLLMYDVDTATGMVTRSPRPLLLLPRGTAWVQSPRRDVIRLVEWPSQQARRIFMRAVGVKRGVLEIHLGDVLSMSRNPGQQLESVQKSVVGNDDSSDAYESDLESRIVMALLVQCRRAKIETTRVTFGLLVCSVQQGCWTLRPVA